VSFQGGTVRSLSHEDNLHHLAIHFHHYKTGIKEFSDVYNYTRYASEHGGVDWDLLEKRILEAGSGSKAHYLFNLVDSISSLGAPQSFFLALEREADAFSRSEVNLRLSRCDLLLKSRSLYESVIEKAYTRYTLETRAHQKIYYFALFFYRLLFPPFWVVARTNVVDEVTWDNFPRLFLANLSRTARVIGDGLGLWVFLVVCVKGSFEILFSVKHYFRPSREDLMSKLLASVDGDEEALQALMDFLE
jgi:hypothetical protein